MALTDDQKAMLRLLSQREEGYEDMAALIGISVEEVRERVKEALAEVDQPGSPAEEAPEPAPATPTPAPPPAPEPPAKEPPKPPATAPTPVPATPAAEAAPASSTSRDKRAAPLPRLKMPKDRGALIGLGAGVLVLLVFAIVLIVSGGGGDSDSSTAASSTTGAVTPAAAENPDLTQAVLSPVDGGDASGKALFGRYKKNVLLQVEAEGLEPSPQGQSYAVWLYRTPKLTLQIGSVAVDDSGKIAAQFQIPPQLLTYVASGAFNQVDVSLISNAAYKAELAKARSERKLPPHSGESVLRGAISGPAIKQQ